jgi:hypothetical protein
LHQGVFYLLSIIMPLHLSNIEKLCCNIYTTSFIMIITQRLKYMAADGHALRDIKR